MQFSGPDTISWALALRSCSGFEPLAWFHRQLVIGSNRAPVCLEPAGQTRESVTLERHGNAEPACYTAMSCLEFKVCQTGRDRHWVVLVDNRLYGRYLDREQAVLDAFDAAEDARRCGRAAQVIESPPA